MSDDEATTSTLLTQQYGGSTLHDEAVLAWNPSTNQVRVILTKDDVLKLVSNAAGKTVTSVVDLTALARDPAHPGELLFALGSTAKGLEGAVFTTAGGGAYAVVNGTKLDGSAPLGLKETPSIAALTVFPGGSTPLVLEADPERLVTPSTAGADIRVRGASPNQRVQLFVTFAARPVPQPFRLPAPLSGAGWAYLTPTDPLLVLSTQLPFLQPLADASGDAVARLPLGPVPPGWSFVVQAVDLMTLAVAEPVAVDLVAK